MDKTTYCRLADFTHFFHLLWIALLIGEIPIGHIPIEGIPILAERWYVLALVIFNVTTLISQVLWLGCPLTTLEHILRKKGDDPKAKFSGSYVYYCFNKSGIEIAPVTIVAQIVATTIFVTIVAVLA